MKRYLSLLAALMMCGIAAIAAEPKVEWINATYDFGAFHEDMGVVTCEFLGVNTGTDPLIVVDARANCGCTRPDYTRNPVMPGDTLKVRVSYDPKGRPGRFNKHVRVTTNSPAGPSNLTITGTVIGSANTLDSRYPVKVGHARLNNDIVTFGTTRRGRMSAGAVHIYNSSDSAITPAVDGLPSYIKGVFSPATIKPGELGILSLTLYTAAAPDYGVVTDSFTIIPDSATPEARQKVETVVIINEDFSRLTPAQLKAAPHATLSRSVIDCEQFNRKSAEQRHKFTITNTGASPLLLRRIYSPDSEVDATCPDKELKPGASTTVNVTIHPDRIKPEGILNSRITIIANDPDNPQQIVRVIGEPID